MEDYEQENSWRFYVDPYTDVLGGDYYFRISIESDTVINAPVFNYDIRLTLMGCYVRELDFYD